MPGSQLRLIAGRTISQLGDGVYEIAMLWAVTHLLKAPWSVAVLIVVGNLVSTLVVPVGGHLADRMIGRRRDIAALADFGAFLLFVAAALVWPNLGTGAAYVALLVVTAATSISVGFLFPSIGALFASLLHDDDRQKVNSLYQTSTSAANLGGLLLGGVLIALLSFQAILWLDAASFGLGCLLTLSVRPPQVSLQAEGGGPGVRDAWREMLRRRPVQLLVGVNVALNGGLIVVMSLLPFFVVRVLHSGAIVLGATQALFAAGLIVGGAGSRWLRGSQVQKFAAGFSVLAACVLVLGLWPGIWVTEVSIFVAAVAASVLSVSLMTLSQEIVEQDQYGKFLASSSVVTTVAQPTLAAAAGAAAALIGVPLVFVASALLTAAGAGAIVQGLRRQTAAFTGAAHGNWPQ